jgi:hypothetical protein
MFNQVGVSLLAVELCTIEPAGRRCEKEIDQNPIVLLPKKIRTRRILRLLERKECE